MFEKQIIEDGVDEGLGLGFVEDGELRVEAERVKIPAHEFEAEAMECRDRGVVEQCSCSASQWAESDSGMATSAAARSCLRRRSRISAAAAP